ncbi:MAG: hypothetical protein ACM3X0_10430 [Bacteroidota bacterium]
MNNKQLHIYVEGRTDEVVVRYLLQAAKLDDGVTITVCGGKRNVAEHISGLSDTLWEKHIALVDADEMSVADSMSLAAMQLGHPEISVYCAVPTIEAWLFADDFSVLKGVRNEHAAQLAKRLPLPEMIVYPKQLAFNIFHKGDARRAYAFLKAIDIDRAASRSPSLRAFLSGVAQALGEEFDVGTRSMTRSISRDVISTLLRELPSEQIAWKTLDGGQLSAGELARAVAEGTDIGHQYATELLRIARDMIVRKAQR